ncbi:S9 family peptidase [Granulicella sp. L46]|uniref:alpha/beta hydrolase family protein n=1 Tax=Granulicella sp. L46 TaxID=1641865 RepID=UPI0020B1420A|nr:S9 family peptidase [Granulicella sp. L46]
MKIRTICAASLLVGMVCAAGGQVGSAKRPMTFADLMAMKRVSDPQVSVSGKWVLFSVTDVSLEKNTKTNHLWVVPVDGAAKERQVTTGSGESGGRLSRDGKAVMYAADGQLVVAAWDDAAGTIGTGRAVTSLETGADGGVWAPDSKHFLFVSDVYPGCEAAVGAGRADAEAKCNAEKDAAAAKSPVKAMIFTDLLYRHWDHYLGEKRSHIFWGSVEGGAPEDVTPASVVGDHEAPTFSLSAPVGYAISPDGKEIAYVVNLDKVPAESTNNDIFVLQVGAVPSSAKKVSTSAGSDDGPAYSPDGKWLAWRSQKRNGFESDKFDLVVMDRGTGAIRDLTGTLENWVDEFAWTPESEGLFYTTPLAGNENIDFVGIAGNKLGFLEGEGEFSDILVLPRAGSSSGGSVLIAVRVSVEHPAEIVRLPKEHARGASEWGGEVAITHLNDVLVSKLDLPKMESYWFAGANGTKVEGFVVRPPHFDAGKKYPVKFLIHGGPQGSWGDAWSYRWNPELFAASGYVVVMVNPRGSTGYGQQFVDEVSGDWGGRPYVDLMKGLDAAEAKFSFIDKTRECALGASYGGFMANWVLTHTDRFKCIVTHDGMYDPVSAFGATEELWFNEWEFRPLAAGVEKQIPGGNDRKKSNGNDDVVEQGKAARPWDFYGKPAGEDPFRKWSPMMFIKDARTPTLVVHSQRDYRLDVSQGLQLFTALQLLGVPSKMLYFFG